MSKISDVPSSASASTEHIDDNSYSDQQESHQTSGIERTYDAAMPLVNFNTTHTSGKVTNVFGNIYNENTETTAPDILEHGLTVEIVLPALEGLESMSSKWSRLGRVCITASVSSAVLDDRAITDNGPPVFWLKGSAGTGKSTIAFTLARSFSQMGILGASFFCSRDDATCSNHKLIFPSIAYHLARFHPPFGEMLAEIVRRRPTVIHSDVAYQLQKLIVEPLGRTRDFPSSCVVVIDALDECKDESTISVILAALSRHVEKLAPLKIFLTSRPERNINLGFKISVLQGATRRFILHEIQLSTVEADIKTYIIAQLEIIRGEYGIDQSWPSSVEVDSLSTLSCGLFIFSATAIKFIQDSNYDDPQGQLTRVIANAMLLKEDLSDPRHRLDQLYLQLLKHEPVDRFEVQFMRQTLMRLHSIILVPESDNAIVRTLHPSFFDFITSPDRCSIPRLLVDTCQQHTLLLAACLRTMQGLKCNVCELPDPTVLNNEVVDLPLRIAKFIPPELQYACRHWGTYLRHAVISEDISILLSRFCSEHMLFWVEACSLLGDLRNQLVLLDTVQRTLEHDRNGSASAAMFLLHDCECLIREFFPIISTAWAHVYESALAFAPQGSELRKCYSSQINVMGGLKEWNKCYRIIEGHSSCILSVAYSPDGTRVASASRSGTIQLWDAMSGVLVNTLEGHSGNVYSVAFSTDGTTIASGSRDDTIRLWDTVSGRHLMTLEGHMHTVISVAYSPNSSRIASGSDDRSIRLWDSMSGVLLSTLEGHSGSVYSVAFSPDGAIIVSGSSDETIRLWDAVSGKNLVTLAGHSKGVTSVAYSLDGTRIASGSEDYTIQMWDAINWRHHKTFNGHQGIVRFVAFSPDGTTIASSSADTTIRLWDAVSGEHLGTLEGHSSDVRSVSFSPEGTRIVSGSKDETIRLWITENGMHSKRNSKKSSRFLHAFSRFKVARGMEPHGHISDTNSLLVSFSPNSSVIVSISLDGSPVLWDAVSGAHMMTLKGHSDRVNAAVFSHDGTRIISASDDTKVRIYDTASGVIMKTLKGHLKPVLSVTCSPDGTRIASGSQDGTTRLWDAVTGVHVHIMLGHQEQVVSVQFSSKGTRIASGSVSDILLWDVLCGSHLVTIMMAPRILRSIAFSPDGNYLIVAISYTENFSLELRALSSGGQVLKVTKSHKDTPALWLPFAPALWIPSSPKLLGRDVTIDDNSNRQWAQASGKTQMENTITFCKMAGSGYFILADVYAGFQ
ncbi:hypothetical protein FIBSPDRAFT_1037952 [Athelia psychrophila]|uniref:NACHT domain-containing protein n=1 Tax=Athelia psychrophila TaxID=1759441 RepID=A0A166TJ89_9AGAM|nr:hypothetical protein FIBSPDRAFT_1037952 [Fibularhizoctonia sp. CBS 109695]